ncbi:MAG: DUF6194 family protein [Pyrinomonadaceae bacterium]
MSREIMDETAITKYILETLDGVQVATDSGNSFFFYDTENKIPFVTIVTNNHYDDVSDLDRPGVFRLNIGVSKQTYRSMFATESPDGAEIRHTDGHDFTALDKLMPHPIYGRMYWVCVLNPSEETLRSARRLLTEAYEIAMRKYQRRAAVSR